MAGAGAIKPHPQGWGGQQCPLSVLIQPQLLGLQQLGDFLECSRWLNNSGTLVMAGGSSRNEGAPRVWGSTDEPWMGSQSAPAI